MRLRPSTLSCPLLCRLIGGLKRPFRCPLRGARDQPLISRSTPVHEKHIRSSCMYVKVTILIEKAHEAPGTILTKF